MAEMHKKEVEVKRVRAITSKEKRRLAEERQLLEEEHAAEREVKRKEDEKLEAKVQVVYNQRKAEMDAKAESWKGKQKAKIDELSADLQQQVEPIEPYS